jgi:hypothetical protein
VHSMVLFLLLTMTLTDCGIIVLETTENLKEKQLAGGGGIYCRRSRHQPAR